LPQRRSVKNAPGGTVRLCLRPTDREGNLKVLECWPSKFLEKSRQINPQTEQHDRNPSTPSHGDRLDLSDNGTGFIAANAHAYAIELIGMKGRAEQIGATLAITSEPGAGTTIIAASPSNSQ